MPGKASKKTSEYTKTAKEVRKRILSMVYAAKAAHIAPSFSVVEILVALYFRCLSVSPDKCRHHDRDKFILSKGHACSALYAALVERGFMAPETLKGFGLDGGTLEKHPNRNISQGIEVSTGSLGHGLSIGIGMAIAARHDRTNGKVFVLLSDGELDEGTVWEAAMFAAHRGLNNLVVIIDYNKIQALGKVSDIVNLEPLNKKWQSFGWAVEEIDGHDFKQIIGTIEKIPFEPQKPSAIIAHTTKGKGVSFMENDVLWHYRCPDEEEYRKALEELS